jgi:hypothetical protein
MASIRAEVAARTTSTDATIARDEGDWILRQTGQLSSLTLYLLTGAALPDPALLQRIDPSVLNALSRSLEPYAGVDPRVLWTLFFDAPAPSDSLQRFVLNDPACVAQVDQWPRLRASCGGTGGSIARLLSTACTHFAPGPHLNRAWVELAQQAPMVAEQIWMARQRDLVIAPEALSSLCRAAHVETRLLALMVMATQEERSLPPVDMSSEPELVPLLDAPVGPLAEEYCPPKRTWSGRPTTRPGAVAHHAR